MKDILLKAFNSASLRYAKGIQRGINMWDERLTLEQKAESLSWELADLGYKIVKFEDKTPTPIATPKIIIKESI